MITPILTLAPYRNDAIDLIELLRQRYGQLKVFLMGTCRLALTGLFCL
jgi:hypothetical protein